MHIRLIIVVLMYTVLFYVSCALQVLAMREYFLNKVGIPSKIINSRFSLRSNKGEGVSGSPATATATTIAATTTSSTVVGLSTRSSIGSSVIAKKVMMLIKRSANSKHTRNGHDLVRQWSDNFAAIVKVALEVSYFSPCSHLQLDLLFRVFSIV